MNFIRDEINGNKNWRKGNGRPDKLSVIAKWRSENLEGTKAGCIRDTGLSKPTVYKWWRYLDEQYEQSNCNSRADFYNVVTF